MTAISTNSAARPSGSLQLPTSPWACGSPVVRVSVKPAMADAGRTIAASQASRTLARSSVAATTRHEIIKPTYIHPMYGVSWNFEIESSRWISAIPASPTAAAVRAAISRASRPSSAAEDSLDGFMVPVSVSSVNGEASLRQSLGQGLPRASYDRSVARVLLVEDDHDIAEPLAQALQREGYDVVTAGDGEVALSALVDAPPDLLILDIGLPGIDGLQVCRRVRELRPLVPILMLTARDGELET